MSGVPMMVAVSGAPVVVAVSDAPVVVAVSGAPMEVVVAASVFLVQGSPLFPQLFFSCGRTG